MAIEKGLLALIITAAIGVLILPTTVSIFSGQHIWYDVESLYGEKCLKCHADIYDELVVSSYHDSIDGVSGFGGGECYVCHRANESITYANGSSNTPGEEAHAASSIACAYCHFNSSNRYNAPIAGGFGLSDLATDIGLNSTHFEILSGTSFSSSIYPDESEGCVICHTPVQVKINFTTYDSYSLVVNNSIAGSTSQWVVESISPGSWINYTEYKK
jgi:hypothetical protein